MVRECGAVRRSSGTLSGCLHPEGCGPLLVLLVLFGTGPNLTTNNEDPEPHLLSLSLSLPSPAASRCPFPPLPVDRACSTKGLMYQDQHKKIPSYYKHFVEVMEKNGWKRGETLFGAPYDWRYVVLHSGPPPP